MYVNPFFTHTENTEIHTYRHMWTSQYEELNKHTRAYIHISLSSIRKTFFFLCEMYMFDSH